ncbi:uncharacterized protein N7483_005973 [Penicillium malachiteum]|uniref:uncharacterized protein n=1 Tax=Penicillium malachiteum TaxID=1324776 RepID=UPI002547FF63|nr:uncharacterized protein N7483_005973 [Penicillium malachiteum]KAJ5731465.1 hypothetical protein N7483_005973 [Penicillium malachiteum]
MNEYPSSATPRRIIGLREICEVNGRTLTRLRGTQQWTEHSSALEIPDSSLSSINLSLVLEDQGEGEPRHWFLFVGRENEPGYVYQVKGDAEYMTYEPSEGPVEIASAEICLDIYHIAVVNEEEALSIRKVAESEPPPRAPSQRLVTENCQGWTIRVLSRLVDMRIVASEKYQMAHAMLQPV